MSQLSASRRFRVAVFSAALLAGPATLEWAQAQQVERAPDASGSVGVGDASMTRDEEGIATVRARRFDGELALDGRLTESIYTTMLPYTGFLQQEPDEGEPATEATEVWLFYDDKNLYVAARLHESDPSRRVMSEMRRDSFNSFNNDHLAVLFDTFNDHRNGFGFAANRLGGMFDWTATSPLARGHDLGGAAPVADDRSERAVGTDDEGDPRLVGVAPLGHDHLHALVRRGRPDHRLEREALGRLEERVAVDRDV